MKKSYHICLSSDNEVMFRDEEDYNRGFNTFALALHKTNSSGLVESFMSNHIHLLVQTTDPDKFMAAYRMPYTKYFNNKYSRRGRLGEPTHFTVEIKGLYHHIAAISYILRNALHHGIAPIPYAYPHSSANVIFQKEMGKSPTTDLISQKSFYKHIGRRVSFPSTYKMSRSGLFLRESVLDITHVENMFVTPRNFDYHMSRKTSEDWLREQGKDHNDDAPITIKTIESKVNMTSFEQMLINESGREDYRRISDIELCSEIDRIIRDDLKQKSVYTLSSEEKRNLAKNIQGKYYPTKEQLCRCLAMKYISYN